MKHALQHFSGFFLCLFLSFFITQSKAQTIELRGRIIDSATQQPIQGATISSSNKTVASDAEGNFAINTDKGKSLTVSFVGYSSRTVTVAGDGMLTVVLSQSSEQLNDVVVTALGVRKEVKRVGYAVQQVSGEDLVKARDQNPLTGLQGKIAGLSVGPSAELLRKPTVLLRGNEITLYVVDGVPINSDTWNINPDDVETYTVLKGPTAAALYGSRAQFGAILITTKKGLRKKGFDIEFNSTNSWDNGFLAFPRLQNEYGPGENELYAFGDGKGGGLNDNDYDVWGPKFDGQPIPQWDGTYDPNQTFTTKFPGYTYTGHIEPTPYIARGVNNLSNFLQTGFQTTNNIALNSTGDNYTLRFSLSHSYQESIIPNTELNITNFSIYGSYKMNNRLTVNANINFNRQYTPNYPDVDYGPNSLIYNIAIWTGADWDVNSPLIKGIWQPGKVGTQSIFAEYQRYHNPWFMVDDWLRGHYKTDINGYISANYRINEHLNVTPRTQITTYNLLRTEKMPYSAHPYGREGNMGDYREDRRDLFESNTDIQLNYNYQVADFVNLSGLVGGSARIFEYNSSWTSTDYLTIPELYTFSNSLNPIQSSSFSSSMRVYSAYYSLDATFGKYATLSATGRVDKSSALPPNHDSYFYPSISVAAPLSDYFKIFPNIISFLKLRASYAAVHSDATSATIGAAPFNTITAFGENPSGTSLFDYPLGYGSNYASPYGGPDYSLSSVYSTSKPYNNQTAAYSTTNIIDPNIKPLNRVNYEEGLDINFLKNRLGLSATAFQYIDGPLILSNAISTTSGYSTYTINALKTMKTGYEISLTGTPIQKRDFKWDVLVNWSTFKDVYDELPPGQTTYASYINGSLANPNAKVGDRVDKFYGSAFVKTTDGQIIYDASGYPLYNPVPQFLGNLNADFQWSIYNKISFKQFTLGIQVDGSVGGVMTDYMHLKTMRGGRNTETIEGGFGVSRADDNAHAGDTSWHGSYVGNGVVVANNTPINFDSQTGAILNYDDLKFAPNTSTTLVQQYVSDYYNTDESNLMSKTFAALREITLGYSLPQSVLKNSFISKLDITLLARNLVYFYKDPRFKDVDVNQYNYATTSTVLQTPTTRRYGININIVF